MEGENHSLLKRYILNTSFHGFRYMAEPNRHWTERVFWIICCSVSWWICGKVIGTAWETFQKNAISFVVETSYIDWDTEFPAIYVCEMNNGDKIAKFSDQYFGETRDYDLDEIVREMAFYTEQYFFTLEMCGANAKKPNEMCKKINFSHIAFEARSSCAELFRKCLWNGQEFDCCHYFLPVSTDIGVCYGLNSLQTRIKAPKLQMISNRVLGPGKLVLELNGQNNVYTMSSLEVPSAIFSIKDFIPLSPHSRTKRLFNIKDIGNQPEVRELSIQQRKCRYPEENYLDVFPYYSYSACLTQCCKDAQLKKCACAHHFMPNTSIKSQCSYQGLECFKTYFQELMVQKPKGSSKLGLECDCLPSCNEIQINVVAENRFGFNQDYSVLELTLGKLPSERYRRTVVNGLLDVTVSIGSAAALFVGASFLSFVELFVYLVVHPLTDYIRSDFL